jgi:hypothetical protein
MPIEPTEVNTTTPTPSLTQDRNTMLVVDMIPETQTVAQIAVLAIVSWLLVAGIRGRREIGMGQSITGTDATAIGGTFPPLDTPPFNTQTAVNDPNYPAMTETTTEIITTVQSSLAEPVLVEETAAPTLTLTPSAETIASQTAEIALPTGTLLEPEVLSTPAVTEDVAVNTLTVNSAILEPSALPTIPMSTAVVTPTPEVSSATVINRMYNENVAQQLIQHAGNINTMLAEAGILTTLLTNFSNLEVLRKGSLALLDEEIMRSKIQDRLEEVAILESTRRVVASFSTVNLTNGTVPPATASTSTPEAPTMSTLMV